MQNWTFPEVGDVFIPRSKFSERPLPLRFTAFHGLESRFQVQSRLFMNSRAFLSLARLRCLQALWLCLRALSRGARRPTSGEGDEPQQLRRLCDHGDEGPSGARGGEEPPAPIPEPPAAALAWGASKCHAVQLDSGS